MRPIVIQSTDTNALQIAADHVRSGGVLVFPTDTVYGLGCGLFMQQSIMRLYEIKSRDSAKAIAILIADTEQLDEVACDLAPGAVHLAARFWPGALTLVVKRHPGIPDVLSQLPTVGVRMPDHEFTRQLLRVCGPMAVTSANQSGMGSGTSIEQILDQLEDRVPLLIDDGISPGGQPSTVVDCTGTLPIILREGPISAVKIQTIWSGNP